MEYLSFENYLGIGVESGLIAETTAHKVLSRVQPTVVSEMERLEIVKYIRKLIRGLVGDEEAFIYVEVGYEVMAYGSMPLKTYLPDGDVDLTIICAPDDVKSLVTSISKILEKAKSDKSGIMEVQVIDAKVEVIKCLVQRVPVDISFNQMAGLNSLCFLEQIDQHIGRDHLFKRSIILIKAWCFYESRLLGSRHGLLSTYALEILILFIINHFHAFLDGPLAVLYKFLDYYSTCDWNRYCISLNGPLYINFLPEMIVDTSATGDTTLLLGGNFLESCIRSFSVPAYVSQIEEKGFQKKKMNIIDPLKVNNNLGFSISKAGFYRITSAFSFGFQKLRDVLEKPVESIGDGVLMFFTNICGKNARELMLDREVAAPEFNARMSQFSDLKGDYDCPMEFLNYRQWYINCNLGISEQPNLELNHWLTQSQTIMTPVTHNIYSPVGGSVVSLSTYPLFSSLLSIDEMAACHEQSHIPSMSCKGKSKVSASAPPFVSSAVGKSVKCEGADLFVPKVERERRPKSKETGVHSPNAQWMNVSEMIRECKGSSQGTSMENQLVKLAAAVGGSSCFGLSVSGVKLNLPPSCEKPGESEKQGESGCFDLSSENFPLLPSRGQKTIESRKPIDIRQTKDSSLKFRELDQDGKSNCFDLSLENFPLLPRRRGNAVL